MFIRLLAAILALSGCAISQEKADAIIKNSVEAIKRDWEAAPDYNCFERDRDSKGSKTYEDLMIQGSPYQRLVAVNGKPLTSSQADEEKRKQEEAIAQRKNESPQQRSQRITKYQKDQERNHAMMAEMMKAFIFNVVGETRIDGHPVYILKARPRAGYRPPNMETQALTGMEGKLWIEKTSFQWVRVETEVIHPVSIEGFLAQVEPGTRFELENAPVAPGVWLPSHFSMRSRAKVLFLIPRHGEEDDTYFNCHKATSPLRPD